MDPVVFFKCCTTNKQSCRVSSQHWIWCEHNLRGDWTKEAAIHDKGYVPAYFVVFSGKRVFPSPGFQRKEKNIY